MELDDYDKLISLCDLLVSNCEYGKIKERMRYIKQKYKVSSLIIKKRYKDFLMLKRYFDEKCGMDIYTLLGIKE